MDARMRRRPILAALVYCLSAGICPAADGRENRDAWQQPQRVVADLGLKPGDAVADIGCGRGYFTFRLGKTVGETGTVHATEISTRALEAVASRVKRDGLSNIKTVLSEPTDTRLESESLDSVLVANVLHHVPQDQRLPLVKDIARAIKPGGFLFILDWRVDATIARDKANRISREDLVKIAREAGLALDAEFHYLKQQVFLRCRKPAGDEEERADGNVTE